MNALERGIDASEEGAAIAGPGDRFCGWREFTEARVVTYSGKFFLPPDTETGREAVVEGRLEPKIFTKKFARHLAEDRGENHCASRRGVMVQ